MTTTEHLARIRAKCEQLLEIAAKRTPGKWYGVIPTGDTRRNDSWLEISNDERNNRATDHDYTFIASCAGAAEAGWRTTIAAAKRLERKGEAFWEQEDKDESVTIIAAWPEELLL